MHLKMRIKANIFYTIIFMMVCIIIFVFIFSSRGFLTLKKKDTIIKERERKIAELNSEIAQISNNINRFKTDREYMLSYAKTFGYLDSQKNEKIVKILKDERDSEIKESFSVNNNGQEKKRDTFKINIAGILILVIMMGICFLFYILMLLKHSQKRYG